jgi:phosphoribosyl 1,2-cyclic phosphodiesterase
MNIFDHCKAVEDIMTAGIDCYMSFGTSEKLDIHGYRVVNIWPEIEYKVINSSWIMKPFDIQHDAAEPLGFILWSKATKDKLVYITDSFYSKYTFHEVNYYLIECNYSEELLNDNIEYGRVPAAQKNRIIKSHMSLKTVKDMLRANDLSQVKEIHLLHLSDRNSSAKLFKKEIQELTGKPVYIAGGRN